ncbi:MAG TPA: hypothetical protein VF992_07475 [Thermoplasmata archaeon]
MERLGSILIGLVVMHLAVTIVHAASHAALQILPAGFDLAFIVAVIWVGPVAALGLFRSRPALAAALIAAFMAASFTYGFYNHFVGASPDNVSVVLGEPWTLVFVGTAAVLGCLELASAFVATLVLRRVARIPSGPAAPPA